MTNSVNESRICLIHGLPRHNHVFLNVLAVPRIFHHWFSAFSWFFLHFHWWFFSMFSCNFILSPFFDVHWAVKNWADLPETDGITLLHQEPTATSGTTTTCHESIWCRTTELCILCKHWKVSSESVENSLWMLYWPFLYCCVYFGSKTCDTYWHWWQTHCFRQNCTVDIGPGIFCFSNRTNMTAGLLKEYRIKHWTFLERILVQDRAKTWKDPQDGEGCGAVEKNQVVCLVVSDDHFQWAGEGLWVAVQNFQRAAEGV